MNSSQVLKALGQKAYHRAFDRMGAVGDSWATASDRARELAIAEQCMNMVIRGQASPDELRAVSAYAKNASAAEAE